MTKRKGTPDVLAQILGGEALLGEGPIQAQPSMLVLKREEPIHQQWEYRVVTFQDYKGWRPRYQNGRELADWTGGPLLHQYLQSLGDEGWELVAASAGERLYGSTDTHQLYFKRPKE
jgi:hypothetical protein